MMRRLRQPRPPRRRPRRADRSDDQHGNRGAGHAGGRRRQAGRAVPVLLRPAGAEPRSDAFDFLPDAPPHLADLQQPGGAATGTGRHLRHGDRAGPRGDVGEHAGPADVDVQSPSGREVGERGADERPATRGRGRALQLRAEPPARGSEPGALQHAGRLADGARRLHHRVQSAVPAPRVPLQPGIGAVRDPAARRCRAGRRSQELGRRHRPVHHDALRAGGDRRVRQEPGLLRRRERLPGRGRHPGGPGQGDGDRELPLGQPRHAGQRQRDARPAPVRS